MAIVKGDFVSEWSDGTALSTYCELNTDTGEVFPEMSDDTDDHGCLIREYFRHTDDEEQDVCTTCHSYLLKNTNETKQVCCDPSCESHT